MSKAPERCQLTGQLSQPSQKRILKEQKNIEKDREELSECGIFVSFTDELHKVKVMVLGPSGTPYENGFYFFDVIYPNNYPMNPPHVDFKTGDGRSRLNPNLYEDGKVCLSILGTWAGPSWTSMMTLKPVLISIQSLLCEHPIQNEPGYENERGALDRAYTDIVRYNNISIAVARMLKNIPSGFECFQDDMDRVFSSTVEGHLQTLRQFASKQGVTEISPIWGFPTVYNVSELAVELQGLRQGGTRKCSTGTGGSWSLWACCELGSSEEYEEELPED